MLAVFDIDGTLDAAPAVFLSMMQALRAAGHHVAIATGSSTDTVTQEDIDRKESYLEHLGFGEAYDTLMVFPDPDISDEKVTWLEEAHADLLVDNKKGTAKKAPCLTLVPWKTRVK